MIRPEVNINTSTFSEMMNELREELPTDNEQAILRNEVERILEKCVDDTKPAQAESIKRRSADAHFSTLSTDLYSPQSGNRYRRGSNVVYYLKNRYPSRLWAAIRRQRAADLAKRLKARGLAKQSWYLIAIKLGMVIKVPDYVRRAVASTGKTYTEDVRTREILDDKRHEIKIENLQPTVNNIGGAITLQNAIDGRVKYFIENLNKGTFESIEHIVRKYKGVFVRDAGGK